MSDYLTVEFFLKAPIDSQQRIRYGLLIGENGKQNRKRRGGFFHLQRAIIDLFIHRLIKEKSK